jgi:hypothetical protein
MKNYDDAFVGCGKAIKKIRVIGGKVWGIFAKKENDQDQKVLMIEF